jgi:hypothetical protein
MTLLEQMTELVKRVREIIAPLDLTHGDTHRAVCMTIADEFELWDADDSFPLWLSRIVEGEMRDRD